MLARKRLISRPPREAMAEGDQREASNCGSEARVGMREVSSLRGKRRACQDEDRRCGSVKAAKRSAPHERMRERERGTHSRLFAEPIKKG